MPDMSTSALWFVKNVLYGKFQVLAKSKSFNISRFNDAIASMVNPAPNQDDKNCGSCGVMFDSRSRPVYCIRCVGWFHKTNCYRGHRCSRNVSNTFTPSSTASEPVPLATSIQSSLPIPSTTFQPTSSPSISTLSLSRPTFSNAKSPSTTAVSSSHTASIASTSPLSLSSPHPLPATASSVPPTASTPSTMSLAVLNPCAPQFSPQPPSVQQPPQQQYPLPQQQPASQLPPRPSQPRRPRVTQNVSSFTPEQAEIESLKIELGFARTKVVDLQTKLNDRDQTISIYSQKIKLFEENRKNSLNDKYFPPTTSPTSSSSNPSSNPSLNLDCSCQIRAQISRNSATLEEVDARVVSALENLERKLGLIEARIHPSPNNPPNAPPNILPNIPPTALPTTIAVSPTSSVPPTVPVSSTVVTITNSSSTTSLPTFSQISTSPSNILPGPLQSPLIQTNHLQTEDFDFSDTATSQEVDPGADTDPEFEFTESFTFPDTSPRINLNCLLTNQK